MRTFIQKIPTLKNLFYPKPEIKALGRWSFLDDAKLYRRADLSNEDHCGPCGEYVINKNPANLLQDKNKLNNMD